MGYAFISYSSKQPRQLNQVKEYLQSNNISFWSAPDDIPVGSKYSEVIKRAIENASCVLFLLSDHSQNSTYCKLEIALALKLEKPVIPIQLEDVILNDDFSLYLSSSEFFPLPKKIATAKTVKLLSQLQLLCTDPDQAPAAPVDPSYRIGWFRKGTWLQLLGWIWSIGGLKFFYAFAFLCFPLPALTGNHPIDYFNGPLVVDVYFKVGILVTVLEMLGLCSVCYGFSLNRKLKGTGHLFFRQFSLCQMLLLISCLCWGISAHPASIAAEHYTTPLVVVCSFLWLASFLLFFITLVIWLFQRIRQIRRSKTTVPG